MGDLRQLKITCPSGIGRQGSAELDGENISHSLSGIDLHIDIDDVVTAKLHLVHVGASFDGQAEVVLPEETQVLLKQLGWTPPDGGDR